MNNFNIEDFTEKHYKEILKLLDEKGYSSIFYNNEYKSKSILVRHDVDFSPNRALALAKIENNVNIQATYFILLGSEFYNVFEKAIKKIVVEIISLGHNVGLHFDPSIYKIITKDDLEKHLDFEKKILEELFDIKIKVFSFHNPNSEIMKYDNYKYSNMINTYSNELKNTFYYTSDSNGYWRHNRMLDIINSDYDKLHLLTHPEWWQHDAMLPRDRVKRAIYGRADKVMVDYDDFLEQQGRKNIGK